MIQNWEIIDDEAGVARIESLLYLDLVIRMECLGKFSSQR